MYFRIIPGNLDLAGIRDRISDEELGASRFVESKMAQDKESGATKMVNVVKFVPLAPGQIPPDPTVTLASGQSAPPPEWRGVMVVKGEAVVIELRR
ncbi:hypothetical protein IEQ11_03590 [Lysobacter capsici]|uniref:hypothetical protein n=1 Tax=Lysobacter capsici TaxID=435897 RepID=UPI00177DA61A|nr:hypothetical protein [Lysobacter capsici]UOF15763.1 hypothetical protein IEQ11_03590 [Lysobacter capsici]